MELREQKYSYLSFFGVLHWKYHLVFPVVGKHQTDRNIVVAEVVWLAL
jgi:hypothetical protein